MSCLVLPRLDYCNSILAGIQLYLVRRVQSVMNADAWLVFSSSKCDHITPHLSQLHWLTGSWRIDFKLAVLVYKCLHGLAPSYLADELHHPTESEFRRRLRFASSHELSVPRTRLSTYGDRAFPVAARSDLEQSSAARHIRADNPAVLRRLLHSLEDILLRTVLFIIFCRACEVTSSFWTR